MVRNVEVIVGEEEGGTRADVLLASRFPSSTRAFCREALAKGAVLLGGRPVAKGEKLRVGDALVVRELKEASDNRVLPDPALAAALRVVYDDGVLIGVDKPAGMPVQPLRCEETGTLANGLVAYAPELQGVGDGPLMAGALHRIDGGTSGLVLASRDPALYTALRDLFAARKVRKTYLALVEGEVSRAGRLVCDLAHDPKFPVCRMVDADGLPASAGVRRMRAETSWRPLRRAGRNTLLEVTIYTGVTHQIRAQLAMAGHPIVNDSLYGAAASHGGGTHLLHALRAEFTDPRTGEGLRVETPVPPFAKGD